MALLFVDGFDHYASNFDPALKWSSVGTLAASVISPGRITGQSILLYNGGLLAKTVANVQTLVAGVAFKGTTLGSSNGSMILAFRETGTYQLMLLVNTTGQIQICRSSFSTVLGTSTQSLVPGNWNFIELKAKIASGTSGTYELRVNGQVWLSSSGANTQASANAYATDVAIGQTSGAALNWYWDDFYLCDTTGSQNNDFLGDVRVQTLSTTADVSKQMSPALIMGNNPYQTAVTTTLISANILNLQKFVAPATGTVSQVTIAFATASGSAKVKGVIYSDSAGSVGTLLTNGTTAEVVGTTNTGSAGTVNVYTFSTPPSVTSGTSYWIGYISDTNVQFGLLSNSATSGTSKYVSNTYTSGAPASPTGFTNNTANILIAATVIGGSTDATATGETLYDGDCSYAYDSTAGHVDRYSYGSLASGTSTVKGVQVSPIMRKSDAGARTARYNLITSATTLNGTTQSPSTSYQAFPGAHNTQADGTTAWTVAAVNALNVSVEVVT